MSNFGPANSNTVNLVPIQGVLDTNGNVTAVVSPNGGLLPLIASPVSFNATGTALAGPSGAIPLPATNTSGGVIGITAANGSIVPLGNLTTAFPLTKWSAALGKMRNGVRNAKLLIIGDSTTVGAGATGVAGYQVGGRLKNITTRLSTEFNRSYTPASCHDFFGEGNMASLTATAAFDSRLVFGAGWVLNFLDGGQLGGNSLVNSTTTSSIDFTPSAAGNLSANIDTFVIWYLTTGSAGVFSYAVDAGGATQINEAGANGVTSVIVPAGSLAAHTLHIARVSGSVFILGVQAYDSTTPQVEVINGGVNSALTNRLSVITQPWSNGNMIQSIAPDLSIIQMQINDCAFATSIPTYVANLQTLINICLTTGDVILRSGYPSAITYNALTTLANQQTYRDAIATLAAQNGILFDDLFGRMKSYEIQQAVPGGAMYTDTLHPTGSTYGTSAYSLTNILRNY